MSAPDIFLSYNREDAERARQFAEGFAAQGLDVWWDVALRSGEAYDKVTEDALKGAKAVVVLWSKKSVDSRWVRAEATLADRKKTLMPAMIEPCERPIMFELVQTAELSHWNGDASDPAWQAFASHVRDFVGKGSAPASTPATKEEPLPSLDQVTVVVLPFANMSRDEDQEYFADGITEDIITDLSKVSALFVIARTTAFTFKGKQLDLGDIARQLNVTHLLEGSVRRAGNRVRVTAQLIDGSTGGHVWAERWDRNLDDIFELQDELSQEIVKALKVKLLPQERKAIESRPTTNMEAYDGYMRARAAANTANGPDAFVAAFEQFKHVLEIDPQFTPALGGLAIMAWNVVNADDSRREAVVADLDTCYQRAAARAPDDWTSQLLRAVRMWVSGDFIDGLEAFEKAQAAAPSHDTDLANLLGQRLEYVGRMAEAIDALEAARRNDPLSSSISVNMQIAYLCAGRPDDARAEYERFGMLGGYKDAMEHNALFRVWLEGDLDATRAQYRRFLDARMFVIPELEQCFGLIDQPEAALAILRKGLEAPENQEGIRQLLLACHAGMHGDPELALAGVRRAAIEYQAVGFLLIWYPFFKDMRQLPGFKQLMIDLGIAGYWRQSGNWGDFARPVGDDDFEIVA